MVWIFDAPQTVETTDGRRVMIAWLQSWDNFMTPEDMDWTGLMTIPRELHVKDGSLVQLPVREIENYYTGERSYENVSLGKPVCRTGRNHRQKF